MCLLNLNARKWNHSDRVLREKELVPENSMLIKLLLTCDGNRIHSEYTTKQRNQQLVKKMLKMSGKYWNH